MKRLTLAVTCLATLLGPRTALAADPTLPVFAAEAFASSKANPYFLLEQGNSRTLKGTRTDGEPIVEYGVLTVQGPGPEILGVSTTTILDEAFDDGRLVERTFDYFAADEDGNVWYFGEDVTNFHYDATGNLTGTDTESAWRAGVNGAKPGITMPGQAIIGLTLFQEHAPADQAMDYAEVLAVDLVIEGPAGTFSNVVKTFEGSTVEADLREYKYYAPGVGMIRADEELTEALDNPAIIIELQP
jgi:hypothetical protein